MFALFLAAVLSQSEGTLVDRVIAAVDREVVTETELVLEARIALARRGAVRSAVEPIDERFLVGFRDFVVNQLLISTQARRLGADSVADVEVDAELERFADNFASRTAYGAFLRRFDISEDRLRTSILRDLRNGAFVSRRMKIRLQGSNAEPSSSAYQEALRLWLKDLRSAAEIRLLGEDGRLWLERPR